MICLTIMIKTSILQVIFTLRLMMLVMSLQHKDNFNVMPGLPPGNEYLIGVEDAERSIHCASLCVITSTCITAVLNTTTRMCGLYLQSQPGSTNSSLSQDAVLILQKDISSGTTTSTLVSTMQETTFAVESRTTIGSLMSMMKETTEETVTTLVTESTILGAVEPGTTTGISVSIIQLTTDETVTAVVTEYATITQPKNWNILGAADCYPSTSLEYNDTINYTVSGIPCQYWNTDTPHYRHYLPLDLTAHDTNYCRESTNYEGGPGCYTSNPAVNWEYCYIAKCDACGVDERLPVIPIGTTSHFHVGKFIGMVFTCDTLTSGTSVEHCPVSQCGSDDQWTPGYNVSCTVEDCYTDSTTYKGKVTCTVTGITCLVWTDVPLMPASPDKDTNYCRDPDNTGTTWWFTTDPDVIWDYCPVPRC